jgi:hypothetical protein
MNETPPDVRHLCGGHLERFFAEHPNEQLDRRAVKALGLVASTEACLAGKAKGVVGRHRLRRRGAARSLKVTLEGDARKMVAESRTVSVGIRCPFDRAYAFLAEPANFPRWASGLGGSLARSGDDWVAETPEGPVRVRFTPPNEYGVLDHAVYPKPGVEVRVPMRVVPNGDGCEVGLTLFRLPGISDEKFEGDAAWVARDLAALKALLESLPR